MMHTRSRSLMLAGAALVALAAAACDHTTQPTPVLSRVEANDMAQELTTDVDLLSSSVTFAPSATALISRAAPSAGRSSASR